MLEQIESLRVGEMADRIVEIRESVTDLTVSLSSDMATQVTFTVSDPDFRMHNAGYFVIRRRIQFKELDLEVASVDPSHTKGGDHVTVEARSRAVQRLKRDKGQKSFGNISPSQFALQKANEFGLAFFGEGSAADGTIIRTQNENTDESTWDVLNRLARDNEFMLFETKNILFFASDKFIIEKQPRITINIPSNEDDNFFLHDGSVRRSDDNPYAAELQGVVSRLNGEYLFPGVGVEIGGLQYYDLPMMITSVEYSIGSNTPVSIGARTREDTEDIGCEERTFRRGNTGKCVRRIQQALGVSVTGTFDQTTENAVRSFQTTNGLDVDGIVGREEWELIAAVGIDEEAVAPTTTTTSTYTPTTSSGPTWGPYPI